MGGLRVPLLLFGAVLLGLAVAVELAAIAAVGVSSEAARSLDAPRPGHGIPYLALLDGLVLFSVLLLASGAVIPQRNQVLFGSIATLVASLLLVIVTIAMILVAISLLVIMVSLLLSPIFGTIAYLAIYGRFDHLGARVVLGLIMMLKLGAGALVLIAHSGIQPAPRLILIFITSFLASTIVSLLHGIVPGFLVSITDVIAAIIVAVLAVIWALVYLVKSIPAAIAAIRVE